MEDTYKDLYGRLTAFTQKLYESAIQSETSIRRQLHYAEQSQSKEVRESVSRLESLLKEREGIVLVLELLLRKTLKEERLARIPEEQRAWFEAVYSSPEGEKFRADN